MLSEKLKEAIKSIYTDPNSIRQYYSCFILDENQSYEETTKFINSLYPNRKPFSRMSIDMKRTLDNAYGICQKYTKDNLTIKSIHDIYGVPKKNIDALLNLLGLRKPKDACKDPRYDYKIERTYKSRENSSDSNWLSSSSEMKFRKVLVDRFGENDIVTQKMVCDKNTAYYHSSDFYIKSLNLIVEFDVYPGHGKYRDRFRNNMIVSLGYNLLVITQRMASLILLNTSFIDELFNNVDSYVYPEYDSYEFDDNEAQPYMDDYVNDCLINSGLDENKAIELAVSAYNTSSNPLSKFSPNSLNNEILRRLNLSRSVSHSGHPRYNDFISYDKILEVADGTKSLDDIARHFGVTRNCIKERIKYEAPVNYRDHLKWMAYYCPTYSAMNYITWRHKYIIQELGIKDMGIPNINNILDKMSEKGSMITPADTVRCIGFSRNKAITMLEKMYRISLTELVQLYNENKRDEILKITRIDTSIRSDYEI